VVTSTSKLSTVTSDLPPVRYSTTFTCSESDLQQTIDQAASFVSKIYATFPKLGVTERQVLRKQGVWIEEDMELPPQSECAQFEANLKALIVATMKKGETRRLDLSTDYSPGKALRTACKSAFSTFPGLEALFPQKSCTTISFEASTKTLKIEMNFKGPVL
jgi:hypothetical protein